ncbi:helicase associated domain family protein, partial [Vibrio parahaemolyticus V-223/04]
VWFWKRQNMVL